MSGQVIGTLNRPTLHDEPSEHSVKLEAIQSDVAPAVRIPRGIRKSLGVILLFAAWLAVSITHAVNPDTLPGPAAIASGFVELASSGELFSALMLSLQRVCLGFAVGITVALVLAIVSGLFTIGEDLIDTPVQMIRTMPWSGLLPLLIIWTGIDEFPKISLIALAAGIPLYINVFAAIRGVDNGLIEAGKTMNLNRWEMIWHLVLPGALPGTLVGIRYALGTAWLALVFAEQINSQGGIGYLLIHARELYRTDIVIVCLIIYAALGLGIDILIRMFERRLLIWRPTLEAE